MSLNNIVVRQPSLLEECPVTEAIRNLSSAGGIEERGAIFTRREVVEFMLDLCGYVEKEHLYKKRVLEPSFGDGDFLLPTIERLLNSWKSAGGGADPLTELGESIRAVELHLDTFERTRTAVVARLVDGGIDESTAHAIAGRWLIHGDFLLTEFPADFDLVIGNPPYVRQELIPDALLREYRSRYRTIYDRADLYVPFIERSLLLLAPRGCLGFICADRWMKNRYGGPLRELVAKNYHLRVYVDMTDTPAFNTEVIAYPAITVIARETPGTTRVAHQPRIESEVLKKLARSLTAKVPAKAGAGITELQQVTGGAEPWLLDTSEQMQVLRRLERDFPLLEEVGCKVGIGVATGADKAFIGRFDELDVEPDRKLPLVMTKDIQSGRVQWRGLGVVNPFIDGPGSGLVDLEDFPRLKRYLEARRREIAGRHVAQASPANWYRTIDRITSTLSTTPKLLIPDIKGEAQIVYEEGWLYPHHNLYYVTAVEWNLRALQAVLLSDVARLFVASYSTKMRGGFLRFQAQYLRRIRLPRWGDVPPLLRTKLEQAAESLDLAGCNEASAELYRLTPAEVAAITKNKTINHAT